MKRKQERFNGLEAHAKSLDADEEQALVDEPSYDIAELVNKVTPENKPDSEDVDFGEPVGKEKL